MVVIKRGSYSSVNLKSMDSSGAFTQMDEVASVQIEAAVEERVAKQVEEHLEARRLAESKSNSKGEFLANLSHEIRTPMNSILGYSQMLLREADLETHQKEHLEKIVLSSRHLLSIVNDVLDLSKIEVGRMVVVESVFDLSGLLNAVEVMLLPKALDKGLRFRINEGPGLPRFIDADEVKIRQIVVNLVANAIKFTAHGQVDVDVNLITSGPEDQEQQIIEISVDDTGSGIGEEGVTRLFKPFEQINDEHSYGAKEGTGLGLAISREYARLLGGDISVESQPGVGSRFTLRVPVKVDEDEGAWLADVEQNRRVTGLKGVSTPVRILTVDDNADANLLTARFLSSIGFEIRAAMDGVEAIQVFEEFHPHLVLMDRRMPKMDGLEAMRHIKSSEQGRYVPVVMITASVFDEDYRECMATGADAFIRKPYLEEELLAEISRLANVRYEYEGARPKRAAGISADQLTGISRPHVKKIIDSILKGDIDELLSVLADLSGVDQPLIEGLTRMAKAYKYDELLALLGGIPEADSVRTAGM